MKQTQEVTEQMSSSTVPKLRFPEFTDEWQVKMLGNIFDVRDGTHESPSYYDTGKPLLTSKNLNTNGTLDLKNVSYISQKDFDAINKRSGVDIDDILFGMIGTIGNPVKVTSNDFAIKNVALLKQKSVKSDYLIQYLRTQIIEKQFYQKNAGGTQKFIALGDIRSLVIGTPSKPEQQKIANFLTTVDKKIETIDKKVELLKQYKKGVMQQIFSQQVRFKDDNGKDYPDWEEKKLNDVVDFIQNGLSIDQNSNANGLKVTRIETISDNKINTDKVGHITTNKDISHYKLQKGDMLFSNINSPAHIGRTVYVDKDYDVYHGMNLLRIRINKLNSAKYLYYVLSSVKYKQWFERICNKAVNQASINQTDLGRTELMLPQQSEQQKIADFLSSIDAKIKAEETKLASAKKFKKALLQRMFV